jgi:hypothetical protein
MQEEDRSVKKEVKGREGLQAERARRGRKRTETRVQEGY